ncbi:carboxypeptidase-like regulatory domain-containing protein [Occallatibacter riparius]|uniref:Carboxypeptidase-like regulatory domain-containing protein n=1 Tax=Occallatibacter riparius TaxID=1002689 RepID=A0A9J7BYK8_9BACT|nr:carboxypeptidase-like regulatory domain-containing protein [Occallatibacter riparius]UWZ86382.1 carboxypeptidase-like regulatory domain-containing protein [Occallatibacter riparius]
MRYRTRLVAGVVLAAAALGFAPIASRMAVPSAEAQNIGQRVVNGSVMDAESGAVVGATVFLRNTKTKAIRSYTSTKDGRFRFAQVDMSQDFDLWAEKEGKKSPTKTISSWDTRKDVETELKLK